MGGVVDAVWVRGSSASEIADSVEGGISSRRLAPGERLPTVRALAERLGVSPATVHAAYRVLRERGLIAGSGRAGTRVVDRALVRSRRLAAPVAAGVRNLADGNPDPALLPALRPALERLSGRRWLYGEPGQLPALHDWARGDLLRDGLPADDVLVVGGAMDGVERALSAHLRPGDAVAVEDPGYGGVLDLLPVLGLRGVPVPVDARGMTPDGLARALEQRPQACVLTPRAQNPTGAALSPARAAELADLLADHPPVLVVEDDHAGPISGVEPVTVAGRGGSPRWAVIRSLTKTLGPDIRMAVLAGDRQTVNRVERRQQAGAGWVSHILQELAAAILTDPATVELIATARNAYADRRGWVRDALAGRDIEILGDSGFNMWLPVVAESDIRDALLAQGWAVRAGESFRSVSRPGLRVTVSTLTRSDAAEFASAVDVAVRGRAGSPTA
jgi:DNA-binding transcriptional MocR family regulator